jgi:hypothetical protein
LWRFVHEAQVSTNAKAWLVSKGYGDARVKHVDCMRIGTNKSGQVFRSCNIQFTASKCSVGAVTLPVRGTQVETGFNPNYGYGTVAC